MDSSKANFVWGNSYCKRTPPPRPTWRSHLMVLLSLIIKKFLSRSLNAPLGCALNARKAVIGDYEQQKPFCPPASQAHRTIVTFLPLNTFSCHWDDFLTKRKYTFGNWLNCPLPNLGKGTCQKRFSGFCPLRGGGTPFSAKEKNCLFSPLIFR